MGGKRFSWNPRKVSVRGLLKVGVMFLAGTFLLGCCGGGGGEIEFAGISILPTS